RVAGSSSVATWILFFLQITLKLDFITTYTLIGTSLILGTPLFIFFGWLSDKIGRLKIILISCLVAALTYFPLFAALTHYVNPDLETFSKNVPITVTADTTKESFNLFVGPWTKFSDVDRVNDLLTKSGLSFKKINVPGDKVITTIGTVQIVGLDAKAINEELKKQGYPAKADPKKVNYPMTILILFIFMIYVTGAYGPIAAFLVELFPTRIRYTSMSLPYHIGNGWFGGMLPLTATAIVALKGDIYYGLWYPVIVSLMTVVVGFLFLKETKDRDINTYEHDEH
ncbi:MAG: MFS transporter, partial [Deltaproteobacteria bacterium]|nr:MFS transporter [Deltaproteobacteria bacterium]